MTTTKPFWAHLKNTIALSAGTLVMAATLGASAAHAAQPLAPQAAAAASSEALSPQALVQTVVQKVLQELTGKKKLSDAQVQDVVRTQVLPYVDFRGMARSAVGFYWRRATPTQRTQLTSQFEKLLVRTYSGALKQVGDSNITVEPVRASPSAQSVVVRTRVVHQGQLINIAYRMDKEAGSWKVVDMNIMGVWLVDNYRGVFADQIQNGGIEGLIRTLQAHNQKAAAS